jgi:hypothetical protein
MPQSAEEACKLLVEGNRDFSDMTHLHRRKIRNRLIPVEARARDGGTGRQEEAPLQAPFAAVLGCADARVPTEIVVGKGSNELVVVRVAGNVLGQECLGSLRYAASHFHAIVDRILIPVRLAAMSIEEVYSSEMLRHLRCRIALIELMATLNGAWNACCLKQEFQSQYP